MQPFVPFTVYIVAVLGGDAAANGIQGVEFRVEGFDPAWLTQATPDPFAQGLAGDPLGFGVDMGYATCQPGPVPLYSFVVFPLVPVAPRVLQVVQHVSALPTFQCPSMLLCTPCPFE